MIRPDRQCGMACVEVVQGKQKAALGSVEFNRLEVHVIEPIITRQQISGQHGRDTGISDMSSSTSPPHYLKWEKLFIA